MDGVMQPWEIWVRHTGLSHFVLQHAWLWPMMETLHYFGLSLLLGTVGLFDLRVLGLAKAIPPAALHRLVPFGVAGFGLNLATGMVFFSGFPEQYAYNLAWWLKVASLTIAGLNALIFECAVAARITSLKPGEATPLTAKCIGIVSLLAWFSVVYWGRMLPFVGDAF